VWDLHDDKFPDGTAWYLGNGEDVRKNGIRSGTLGSEWVENNSPHTHFITDPVSNRTTEV
jgi:hypothetical protein